MSLFFYHSSPFFVFCRWSFNIFTRPKNWFITIIKKWLITAFFLFQFISLSGMRTAYCLFFKNIKIGQLLFHFCLFQNFGYVYFNFRVFNNIFSIPRRVSTIVSIKHELLLLKKSSIWVKAVSGSPIRCTRRANAIIDSLTHGRSWMSMFGRGFALAP